MTIPKVVGRRASPAKWERGRLLQIDYGTSTVFAFDAEGRQVLSSRIWPENSQRVKLYNVTVSPSGAYAVDATAVALDGTPAAFIVFLDAGGHATKFVRTSPAAALSIRFADDGTLWAVVRVHNDRFEDSPDYDMLRHYDASGVLIGTALPRSRFKTKQNPAFVPILTSSGTKIGLYADVAMTWIELSSSGEVLGHWSFPHHEAGQKLDVWGAAWMETGELLISASTNGGPAGEESGLYLFDRDTQSFRLVDTSQAGAADPVSLAGLDGQFLVTRSTAGGGQVQWTKLH